MQLYMEGVENFLIAVNVRKLDVGPQRFNEGCNAYLCWSIPVRYCVWQVDLGVEAILSPGSFVPPTCPRRSILWLDIQKSRFESQICYLTYPMTLGKALKFLKIVHSSVKWAFFLNICWIHRNTAVSRAMKKNLGNRIITVFTRALNTCGRSSWFRSRSLLRNVSVYTQSSDYRTPGQRNLKKKKVWLSLIFKGMGMIV